MREALFNALSAVTRLDFDASSGPGSKMGWNHHGSGTVQVIVDGNEIHFTDSFTLDNGTPCQDRKCWHFTDDGVIFRHYRQQQFQDILLFPWPAGKAVPAESDPILLAARSPYLCPPDTYDGTLQLNGSTLTLSLRITGTRKDESIRYTYTPAV